MSRRRVYLPADADDLRIIVAGQPWPMTGRAAFAVTQAARLAFADDDEEDLEYDAFLCASRHGTRPEPEAGSGLVVSLDVEAELVDDTPAQITQGHADQHGFVVAVRGEAAVTQVVAIHAPDPAGGPDDELLWYDVSEASALLSDLGSAPRGGSA